jgi:hypothetical protein
MLTRPSFQVSPFRPRTPRVHPDERLGLQIYFLTASYAMYPAAEMGQFERTSVSGRIGILWRRTAYIGVFQPWLAYHGMENQDSASSLQLRILQRAMRMLRPGGKIVYSTCSLNPVENEAVVAEALRTIPGMLLLVSLLSIHTSVQVSSWLTYRNCCRPSSAALAS